MTGALAPVGLGVLLGVARLWPLLLVQTVWRRTAGPVWWWLSGCLALLLAVSGPAAAPARAADPGLWLGEVAIGLVLGTVASLPGLAFMGAAEASARVLWPRGDDVALLPAALAWAVAAVALAGGLHRPVLLALFDLTREVPPGAFVLGPGRIDALAAVLADAAALGLALATPALLVAATATTATRLLHEAGTDKDDGGGAARVAGSWARAGAALVALGASLAARAPDWAAALLPAGLG